MAVWLRLGSHPFLQQLTKEVSTMFRIAKLISLNAALLMAVPVAVQAASGDTVPGHPNVLGEYVQIQGIAAAGTPGVLNTASYLRVRLAADGKSPKPANAVVIAQPGFSSTPGIWAELSAQLVEKASSRDCGEPKKPSPCRIEVWIMDRRGSQIEDTTGLRIARSANDPSAALDYYFGSEVLNPLFGFFPPGRFPILPDSDALFALPFGTFEPLTNADVPFMSEWGFETMAGDVDALLSVLPKGSTDGDLNVFLAGHSQGGGFVSLYAGRRLPDGRRGHENPAGLIFLDGGPSIGNQPAPTPADINDHLLFVGALRTGAIPVFGASLGGVTLSTGLGVQSGVVGAFQDQTPNAESIFVPNNIAAATPFSPQFNFLLALRHTYRANAGLAFDADPIPCTGAPLQIPFVQFLGLNQGELDFPPFTGTATPCNADPSELNSAIVYDWIDGGGTQPAGGEPTRADAFMTSNGYGPSFTNVGPVTVNFPSGRSETLDAGEMNGFTWYQSVRYDGDSGFLGGFQVINFDVAGVSHDIDRTTIAAPTYVARRFPTTGGNPFPVVDDYTEINFFGTVQSPTASALTPISPAINSSQYNHSDFLAADDSLAGVRTPGQAGASLTSNTLVDWLLARSAGRTPMPKPKTLGIVKTR
jgi:pimeloyl-ACP methyl ester carboxylesterase